jgi:hypothetical protein
VQVGGGDQPLARLDGRAIVAATHEHRAVIQVGERGHDRIVMRIDQHARQIIGAGGGEDADRLRR